MSEVRTLSLHPLAIHTFIKAQAGSLGKALSEAVMNSLDAFASSVQVTLTSEGFVIEDNGQGFRNKEEISAWFETLGFPHDDGNHRIFGKFGMGRCQMWAFARTVWTSNEFVMRVDVKNKGLDYELELAKEPFKGTRIEAKFYEALPFAQQQLVETELHQLVKYVPGTVFINGKMANKDPGAEDWDLETPEAWFRFDKKEHTLSVYNAGLLVSHFPKYRFGCAGVVVTKPDAALSLNLARNEILEAECKVWKAIVKSLPKKDADYKVPKRQRASLKEMESLGRQVAAGTKTLAKALEAAPHMLVNVLGRPLSVRDVSSYHGSARTVVFVPKSDEFGKRISKLRLATVVALESLKNFNCESVEAFKDLVLKSLGAENDDRGWNQRVVDSVKASLWTQDPAQAFPELAAGKKVYTFSELVKEEKAVLAAWQRSRGPLLRALHDVTPEDYRARIRVVYHVALGDSPMGENSWLDETAHSWVLNKKDAVEAMGRSLPVLTRYAMTQLNRLCEQVVRNEAEGRTLFIRLVSETEALGTLMLNLTRFYVNECRQKDLPVQPTRLRELDELNVE